MESHVHITMSAASLEQLRAIARRHVLDLNCGGARRGEDGAWRIDAYVSAQVAADLEKSGVALTVDRQFAAQMATRQAEVGTGDRFQGGRAAPRGLGRKE
jgi:hypothetical protein